MLAPLLLIMRFAFVISCSYNDIHPHLVCHFSLICMVYVLIIFFCDFRLYIGSLSQSLFRFVEMEVVAEVIIINCYFLLHFVFVSIQSYRTKNLT